MSMPEKDEKNKDNDKVGYRMPPSMHQWKKGLSGNPKGRPRKQDVAPTLRLLREQLFRAAMREVSVMENGRPRKMHAMEAIFNQLVAKAAAGNMQAIRMMIDLMQTKTDEHEEWQLKFFEMILNQEEHEEEKYKTEMLKRKKGMIRRNTTIY